MLHATFLAAVTEFVWLPWRAAQEGSLVEGAMQGGSQVRHLLVAIWHLVFYSSPFSAQQVATQTPKGQPGAVEQEGEGVARVQQLWWVGG